MVNDELNIKLIEKLDTIIHIVNSIEYSEKIELVLEELSRLSLVKGCSGRTNVDAQIHFTRTSLYY